MSQVAPGDPIRSLAIHCEVQTDSPPATPIKKPHNELQGFYLKSFDKSYNINIASP